MPMNDTTQANATANTAFGCLNGLVAEPAWAPLNVPCAPYRDLCQHRLFVAASAGESVESGQRGRERGAVFGTELGEDYGQPVGPPRTAARQCRPARIADAYLDCP